MSYYIIGDHHPDWEADREVCSSPSAASRPQSPACPAARFTIITIITITNILTMITIRISSIISIFTLVYSIIRCPTASRQNSVRHVEVTRGDRGRSVKSVTILGSYFEIRNFETTEKRCRELCVRRLLSSWKSVLAASLRLALRMR